MPCPPSGAKNSPHLPPAWVAPWAAFGARARDTRLPCHPRKHTKFLYNKPHLSTISSPAIVRQNEKPNNKPQSQILTFTTPTESAEPLDSDDDGVAARPGCKQYSVGRGTRVCA